MGFDFKKFDVTSGKGFKYTDPLPLYRSRKTRVTAVFKQVPGASAEHFHHLELTLNKTVCEKEEWTDAGSIKLCTYEKNNEVTHDSIGHLIELINAQMEFANANLGRRSTVLVAEGSEVAQAIEILKTVTDRARIVEAIKLLAENTSLDLSDLMRAAFSPSAVRTRTRQIRDLKALVDSPGSQELEIQRKLSEMPWVFGLEYEKLDVRTAGPAGIPDRRLKRIDGLSDLLEIKLPSAELLRKDSQDRRYIAPDLAEALGQLMGYLEHFYSSYQTQTDDDTGEEMLQDTYGSYYKPRGILLIGRRNATARGRTASKAEPKYLRRLLSYFHWIDVLTYDDLLDRASNLIRKMGGA